MGGVEDILIALFGQDVITYDQRRGCSSIRQIFAAAMEVSGIFVFYCPRAFIVFNSPSAKMANG
jgi:hypothetical protein